MSLKKILSVLMAAGIVLCFGLVGCAQSEVVPQPPVRQEVTPEVPAVAPVKEEQPAPAPQPAPEAEPALETEPEEMIPPYDFTRPAPETEAVDKEYFADAAFVGDSRTDGFMIYSGVGRGDNLTSNGLSIFRLETKKALKIGGEEYTLLEALERKQYGKVYLCLGVNELGIYKDDAFYESYLSAIDAIRAAQPGAIIYIQGLIPLNEEEVMAKSGKEYLKNDHLRVYNELMFKAAQEKQVVFLDLYTAFADENGALPAGASRDGVHLTKEYCIKWLEYLQTHTVDPAQLSLPETVAIEKEENITQ